jgi:hypothetical protein
MNLPDIVPKLEVKVDLTKAATHLVKKLVP